MGEAVQGSGVARLGAAARWLIVMLLAAAAAALLVEWVCPPAQAAGQGGPAAGAGRILAVAGQVSRDTYGLYLIDLENGTICVYEYVAGRERLCLRAARTYEHDRQLDSYNTEPAPAEIKRLVGEARRLKDASGTTTRSASP